jgi:polyhydroxyalkanoate synthesis regulator phasin
MREAIKRYVEAAQSLTEVPRERAERVARRLAGSGMIDAGQIRDVASDLVDRSRQNRRKLTDVVTREIRRQVSRLGLARTSEVERLAQRVQALEVAERRARQSRVRATTMPKKTAKRSGTSRSGATRKPSRSR